MRRTPAAHHDAIQFRTLYVARTAGLSFAASAAVAASAPAIELHERLQLADLPSKSHTARIDASSASVGDFDVRRASCRRSCSFDRRRAGRHRSTRRDESSGASNVQSAELNRIMMGGGVRRIRPFLRLFAQLVSWRAIARTRSASWARSRPSGPKPSDIRAAIAPSGPAPRRVHRVPNASDRRPRRKRAQAAVDLLDLQRRGRRWHVDDSYGGGTSMWRQPPNERPSTTFPGTSAREQNFAWTRLGPNGPVPRRSSPRPAPVSADPVVAGRGRGGGASTRGGGGAMVTPTVAIGGPSRRGAGATHKRQARPAAER